MMIKRVIQFDLKKEYLTLTSALYPEGITFINKLILIIVKKEYCNTNPWNDIMRYADKKSLVFMTAAEKFLFNEYEDMKLFISAGINGSGENAGCTINIAVFLDQGLNINGLVDLIRTVEEAKCGALRDLSLPFTGTASDAVAVGSLVGKEYFAGPSTDLGKKVAKRVRERLKELLM